MAHCGVQLDQRELDALVGGQRLAERRALVRAYSTASLMQNCAAPSDDAAWRMRFSLHEVLRHLAGRGPRSPNSADLRHPHVGEAHVGVVRRHVERPPEELDDLEARRRSVGTRNAVMPVADTRVRRRAGEDRRRGSRGGGPVLKRLVAR